MNLTDIKIRMHWCWSAFFLCACLAHTDCLGADEPRRPNILLILADDLGYSDIGCYGGEIDTPNLDKLGEGGLRFSQFYNTGRCWPTRASIMTGLYPHQAGHAMRYGPGAPPGYQGTSKERAPMLSEILNTAGYRCYHVGKWHLNGGGKNAKNTWPLDRGFHRSYCVRTQHNFHNPVQLTDEDKVVRRSGGPVPMGDGSYYVTTAFTDRAIDYLKEHKEKEGESPFFLYLAHTAPHFPLHATPEDIARFKGRYRTGWDNVRSKRHERTLEMGITAGPLPARDPGAKAWDALSDEEKDMWDTRMAIHAAMIYRMDVGIGRIVEQLKAMGEYEDTLIMFLSDNGASAEYLVRGDGHDPDAPPGSGASYLCLEVGWSNACNSPFRMHKMWMHEGGIATPMVVHWPNGITAEGAITGSLGHVIDIFPTMMELCDAERPDGNGEMKYPELPGKSLAQVFRKPEEEDRERMLFFEHTGNRALRLGTWKLVAEDKGDWELYDMSNDRGETANLRSTRPELVAEMAKQWNKYAAEIGVVDWGSLPQSKRTAGPDYRKK